MNFNDRLRAQLEGSMVQRCHTTPHHGSYDNAQHSFRMLILLFGLHPNPSMDLVRAVTYHDLPERFSGDVPSPAKKHDPDLKSVMDDIEGDVAHAMDCAPTELTADEWDWLRALDEAEYTLYAHQQILMGNRLLEDHIPRQMRRLGKLDSEGKLPAAIRDFMTEYRPARGPDWIL